MAWFCGGEHLLDSPRNCLALLGVYSECPSEFGKYINHGEKVSHYIALPGDTLHIGQVGLTLSIDTRYINVVPRESTARLLVQRIGLLAL